MRVVVNQEILDRIEALRSHLWTYPRVICGDTITGAVREGGTLWFNAGGKRLIFSYKQSRKFTAFLKEFYPEVFL